METISVREEPSMVLSIIQAVREEGRNKIVGALPDDLLVFLNENERGSTRRLYEYMLKKWVDYRIYAGFPNDLYLQHLSGVRNRLAPFMDITFSCSIKNAIIAKFIRAGRYTREERLQRDLASQAREKLPMPDVMLVWLHRVLWLETRWNWDGIYRKGTWLACVILMIRGVRISSVCLTKAEHELLTTGVSLFIRINDQRVKYVCGNSPWIPGALPGDVLAIEMRICLQRLQLEVIVFI